MKSMLDYVSLEGEFYKSVLEEKEYLFNKIEKIEQSKIKNIKNVVIYATGSSSNAAFAARPFMSQILQLPVYIEEPSIAANYMLLHDETTLYIAISQGGHSFSTINMVENLESRGATVLTITSDMESPIAKRANNVINMGMPIEEMPYVTAGYSVTILDLMLISLVIGQSTGKVTDEDNEKYISEFVRIANLLPEVIKKSNLWYEENKQVFLNSERMIFIGYGAAYGVAREGETKITETVRITAQGKELEEYMHGPYLGLHAEDTIFFVDPNGRLHDRANKLRVFLSKHVSNVFNIYANENKENTSNLNLDIETDELISSLFMTIPIHLLSYYLSQEKGNNLEVSAFPEFDEITKSKI